MRTRLPGIRLGAMLHRDNQRSEPIPLVLDGVHIDAWPLTDHISSHDRVYLTWRGSFSWNDGNGQVELRELPNMSNV